MFGLIKKQKPTASSVQAICGNVKRNKVRLPTAGFGQLTIRYQDKRRHEQVSMVNMAGQANKKFAAPKPSEAKSACRSEYPASENTVNE
jgi:hypothetical protein